MFICRKCGECVEELEVTTQTSEFWGSKAIEFITNSNCSCGGEFVTAEKCSICGDWFVPEELSDGICKLCLEEENSDQENVK